MKFKLDENIGRNGAEILRAAGHDVSTVREQRLEGAPDEDVFATCAREERALITLDHDFGQVLRFPPEQSGGIAILELGPRPSPAALRERILELIRMLDLHTLQGALWIVEPGRVRIHVRREDD